MTTFNELCSYIMDFPTARSAKHLGLMVHAAYTQGKSTEEIEALKAELLAMCPWIDEFETKHDWLMIWFYGTSSGPYVDYFGGREIYIDRKRPSRDDRAYAESIYAALSYVYEWCWKQREPGAAA